MSAWVRPETGENYWLLVPRIGTDVYSQVLAEFARAHGVGSDKHIVLVVDRAGWHRSPKVVLPEGLHLVFLPPYAPELQPAERRWALVVFFVICPCQFSKTGSNDSSSGILNNSRTRRCRSAAGLDRNPLRMASVKPGWSREIRRMTVTAFRRSVDRSRPMPPRCCSRASASGELKPVRSTSVTHFCSAREFEIKLAARSRRRSGRSRSSSGCPVNDAARWRYGLRSTTDKAGGSLTHRSKFSEHTSSGSTSVPSISCPSFAAPSGSGSPGLPRPATCSSRAIFSRGSPWA